MTRRIDSTQVAVLYETITGQCQKRGVITTTSGTVDIDAVLASNPGLAAAIVSRSALPGGAQNETFFRQVVATATGTAVFAHGADRAVQVDGSGNVVSLHNGNVPGLDKPDTGHQLISHAAAEVGDTYAAGVFSRRYVVFNATTGLVASVVTLPLGQTPTATAGQSFSANTTAQVGTIIPIKSISVAVP